MQYELSHLHAQLDVTGNHPRKFGKIPSINEGGVVRTKIEAKM